MVLLASTRSFLSQQFSLCGLHNPCRDSRSHSVHIWQLCISEQEAKWPRGGFWGPVGTHWNRFEPGHHWPPDLWTGELQLGLRSSTINVSSEKISDGHWKVKLFPLPKFRATLVNTHRFLWGRLRRKIRNIHFWWWSRGLFKGIQVPLHPKSSVSINWLKSGNWLKVHNFLFWFLKVQFHSLNLKLFCLLRSIKTWVGCPSTLVSEMPWSTSRCQKSVIPTALLWLVFWFFCPLL